MALSSTRYAKMPDMFDWKTIAKQTNFGWVARNDRGLTLARSPPISSTSIEDVINAALTALDRSGNTGELCRVVGREAVIDEAVVVEGPAKLSVDCLIKRHDNTTCTMLENANPAGNDVMVEIDGGIYDGNRDNVGRGETIDWEHSTQPADGKFATVKFSDMELLDADEHALHVDAEGSSETIWYFEDFHFRHCGRLVADIPMYFYKVYDTFMERFLISTFSPNIGASFFGGGPYKMNNMEFAHQTKFEQTGAVYMTNALGECIGDLPGFLIKGCNFFDWDNVYARIGGDGEVGSAAAYRLESSGGLHSHDNNFLQCGGGRRGWAGTSRWDYIFQEADANQHDNSYEKVIADDYLTAIMDLQGTRPQLQPLPLKFVADEPSGALNSTYGIDVDLAAEVAVAAGVLPPYVREVVFIEVDAYGVAPSGAGQYMEIELLVDGGTDNEPFGTHSTVIANLDNLSVNTIAGDNLIYRINSRDYANIRALTAGDRVLVRLRFEVGAVGADTDLHAGSATLLVV